MARLGIPETAFNNKGKKVFQAVAHGIREDGAFIEAGENDNLIVQKLEANPNAVGIFGFSFLDQNADKIQGAMVDGKAADLRQYRRWRLPGLKAAVLLREEGTR